MGLGLFFRQLPAMEKILYRAIHFLAIGCPRLFGREQPQAKSSKTKKLVTADSIGTRSGLCSRCPRAEAGLAVRHRTTHSDDCKNRTCPTVACLLHPYKAGCPYRKVDRAGNFRFHEALKVSLQWTESRNESKEYAVCGSCFNCGARG